MSTFGSFSGGAAALLEATPLVAGTQKYQSDQSGLGMLGGTDRLDSWGLCSGCQDERPGVYVSRWIVGVGVVA